MPFCTIVELEWTADFGRTDFEAMMASSGADAGVPEGLLTRIVGIDDSSGRIVELWQSGAHAQAFAEQTAPVTGQMPAPTRVVGFEVSSYQTA
jgi:hypothetical protein